MFHILVTCIIFNLERREIYLGTSNLQHILQHKYMCGEKNCNGNKEINLLTWSSGPLCKDANLNPCWSHALDQLPHFSALFTLLPSPKHPLFLHHTHTCDKDNINMLNFSLIWHRRKVLKQKLLQRKSAIKNM